MLWCFQTHKLFTVLLILVLCMSCLYRFTCVEFTFKFNNTNPLKHAKFKT